MAACSSASRRDPASAAMAALTSRPVPTATPAHGSAPPIARDENDNMEVRRAALGVLARLDHGAGIPPLIDLARANLSGDRTWLSKESLNALARSGDPRARDFLRSVVQRADVADEVLYTAIRGLGTEYATGRDAELLRQVYAKLTGEHSRDAVLSALAEIGVPEKPRWLLGCARYENAPLAIRRRAFV